MLLDTFNVSAWSERDSVYGERNRNISGVFDLAVNDWAERTHTQRNIEPLRFSHILWYKTLIR